MKRFLVAAAMESAVGGAGSCGRARHAGQVRDAAGPARGQLTRATFG